MNRPNSDRVRAAGVSGAQPLDCLVIGGGPAGLTAAIYLARFHLAVTVADAGDSRAALIPRTRNHAGFPKGIAGAELLSRMREQALLHGAVYSQVRIEKLDKDGDVFLARGGPHRFAARSVLLATGVSNHRPDMDEVTHGQALSRGLLRYCPICDGYEVTDQRVAVLGTGAHGYKESIFLRSYTSDVTLIAPDGRHALSADEETGLRAAGINLLEGPCTAFLLGEDGLEIALPGGHHRFATLYPALGSTIHSQLAVDLGAEASGDGCLVVDSHQRTSVPGLYAAGDVVLGLDQISHAMGKAVSRQQPSGMIWRKPHRFGGNASHTGRLLAVLAPGNYRERRPICAALSDCLGKSLRTGAFIARHEPAAFLDKVAKARGTMATRQ
jgi:thioredoxin reductase (NADPH)